MPLFQTLTFRVQTSVHGSHLALFEMSEIYDYYISEGQWQNVTTAWYIVFSAISITVLVLFVKVCRKLGGYDQGTEKENDKL